MKTLFLIDGASGTGKSDIIRYVTKKKKNVATFIPKYTTRDIRPMEKERKTPLDLTFPPDSYETFMERTKDDSFYWYTYGDPAEGEEYYGFYEQDIINAFNTHDIALIVVRDLETIQSVKNDFPNVSCISVFIYTDRDLVVKRLKNEGASASEVKFRLSRQPLAWSDYLKYTNHYDEKMINSSERKDFELLIENLIGKYITSAPNKFVINRHDQFRLVTPLIGFKAQMLQRLNDYPYDRNIFLMMKFRGENKRVFEFIKKTLSGHGFNVVRADETYWDITRNTYNPVAVLYCCKYGIALFDEPEPGNDYSASVAYELGMMHQQGKECLILRHKAITKVPFDLVKELYVDYKDNLELEDIINDWVKKIAFKTTPTLNKSKQTGA